jgi:transposase
MNQRDRNEIVRLDRKKLSHRRIAKLLGMSRRTVRRVLEEVERGRREGVRHPDLPRPAARHPSQLDGFEDRIRALLESYPDLTAVRLVEELRPRS